MASTYLSRTLGTSTDEKKFTFSAWVKLGTLGSDQVLIGNYTNNDNKVSIMIDSNGKLKYYPQSGGAAYLDLSTNRRFRDVSGWYHIVIAADTTQGTTSDRVKIYVNGVQETSLATTDYPGSNQVLELNKSNTVMNIGRYGDNSKYFTGSMSHVHFVDGTAYPASTFGSTDSTTGEWKINTSPSVTYGTNGFFILKDGNSVTDLSGQGNNYTVAGGTLTKTEDNPSNVFNILNPLYLSASKFNFIQGNLRSNGWSSGTSQTWRSIYGTLGASSGKYYFEMKCDNMYSGDTGNIALGIVSDDQVVQTADNSKFFNGSTAYAYAGNGQKLNNDDSIAGGDSYGSSFTTNDIISCAYDLDNGKIYWAKNGTWANSGDPTSGSTGTGSAFNLTANLTYLPAVANYYDDDRWSFNFGNGYFGATAVSSAGTNASNNGIFEYDVPTGYTALSTKGLNT